MLKIYHYDTYGKREKVITVKFNKLLCGMMGVYPSGDIDGFLKAFGDAVPCDRWIEFHSQRFRKEIPANLYLGLDIDRPDAVLVDESKLVNTYGDCMSTTQLIWSESWSEGFELYRASILVWY